MIRRTLFLALLGAVSCALLAAADISGDWAGVMSFGDNKIDLTYTFKQEGAKLTGTVHGPGGDLPLNEGKIQGEKVSFSVTVDMNGSPAKFVSQGNITGDEIALTTTQAATARAEQ